MRAETAPEMEAWLDDQRHGEGSSLLMRVSGLLTTFVSAFFFVEMDSYGRD